MASQPGVWNRRSVQRGLLPLMVAALALIALSVVPSADGQNKAPKAGRVAILDSFTGHTKPVGAVAFGTGGKSVISLSTHEIKVWDVATGKCTKTIEHSWARNEDEFPLYPYSRLWPNRGDGKGPIPGAVSPDGKIAAIGKLVTSGELVWGIRTFVEFHDLTTGKKIGATDGMVWPGFPGAFQFSPNGKVLAFAEHFRDATKYKDKDAEVSPVIKKSQIHLWNAAAGKHLGTLTGHTGVISSCTFSAEGQSLAVTSLDGVVKIWDLTTGETSKTFEEKKEPWVSAAAFSRDGKMLAYSAREFPTQSAESKKEKAQEKWKVPTLVKLVDLATGKISKTFSYPPGEGIACMAFNNDGRILAVVNNGPGEPNTGKIKLWNVANGKDLISLGLHNGFVHCMAFSPDGKQLATAGADKTVKLWGMPEQPHTFAELKLYNPILTGK